MLVKKILLRAGAMCDQAYLTLKLTAAPAILLLLSSLLCHLFCPELTADTYRLFRLAQELSRLPAGLLLAGVLVSVCIEDIRGDAS